MNLFGGRPHAPLPAEGYLPGFDGATGWLNTQPLTMDDLRGKVVLVDLWTYTCINWLRTLAFVRALACNSAPMLGNESKQVAIDALASKLAASAWAGDRDPADRIDLRHDRVLQAPSMPASGSSGVTWPASTLKRPASGSSA